MQWWRAALERGLASPLAPKRNFPPIDALGVVAILTDAVREDGTGVGGYAPIMRAGATEPTLLYVAEEWPTCGRGSPSRQTPPQCQLARATALLASSTHS
eukprot:460089-Prymnesium_polylepis.1